MPTINKKEIKTKPVKYKHESKEHAQEFYNSQAWHKLRNTYLSQHPICEECVRHERVVPAEHVHHKHFWDSFNTEELKWKWFLDWNNLESLCTDCHYKIHNKARHYGITFCDSLTDKEWRND